jgi:hypothetical protein
MNKSDTVYLLGHRFEVFAVFFGLRTSRFELQAACQKIVRSKYLFFELEVSQIFPAAKGTESKVTDTVRY